MFTTAVTSTTGLRDLDGEFTLAMLDLDHFKHINDTYGHLAGDAAVSRAAQAIRSAIRTSDELVRYGGDEFLLLFHDMPRNALKKKLESIRAAVESLEFPEYPGLRITVSIGAAHASVRSPTPCKRRTRHSTMPRLPKTVLCSTRRTSNDHPRILHARRRQL